jgi:hypothetical protein
MAIENSRPRIRWYVEITFVKVLKMITGGVIALLGEKCPI